MLGIQAALLNCIYLFYFFFIIIRVNELYLKLQMFQVPVLTTEYCQFSCINYFILLQTWPNVHPQRFIYTQAIGLVSTVTVNDRYRHKGIHETHVLWWATNRKWPGIGEQKLGFFMWCWWDRVLFWLLRRIFIVKSLIPSLFWISSSEWFSC